MTNHERIIDTLQCKETDRAPFSMWLGFSPWDTALERWKEESGIADLDVIKYFGFEPFFQNVPVEYGPMPHFESEVIEQDGHYITQIDYRGLTVRSNIASGSIPEFVENPIKTKDDWLRYKAERLKPCLNDRLSQLSDFAEAATIIDAPIQVGAFPWGIFGTIRDLRGTEKVLFDFYDYPDLVFDIMETYTSLWLSLYERIADVIDIDHIHIWEDMSGKQGSLISMNMIEEFVMPQYDRIADFCRRHNVPVFSVDSDGCVDQLVPTMMSHGVNAFMPFEVQAGCDIEEYRRLYPGIGIIGGLDKNALAANKKAIHSELDKAQRMLAAGGYVPGFDHMIPPNIPWENYKYAVNELRRMIGI
jgi:uroporphyrinogen-III decarboxylase